MDLITFDSGYHTGYSIWGGKDLAFHGTIIVPDKLTQTQKLQYLFENVGGLTDHLWREHDCKAYIEGVQYQFSLKSMTSTLRGDTFTLAYAVGVIFAAMQSKGIQAKIVLPSEWKGQLTKQATKLRVFRQLPYLKDRKLSEHELDAIGLGLAMQGRL